MSGPGPLQLFGHPRAGQSTGSRRSGELSEDALDAAALDDLMFADLDAGQARGWCDRATREVTALAARRVLECSWHRRPVTVVDYGTGSGLGAKYLYAALRSHGRSVRWIEDNVELVVVDLPGPWFVAPERLAGLWPSVRAVPLSGASGRISSLDDLVGPSSTDVVLANMVVHLIPERAFPRAVDGVRRALRPDGLFVWNSPDTAPRFPRTVLFHDANRLIRSCFAALKRDRGSGRLDLWRLSENEQAELSLLVAASDEITAATAAAAAKQVPDRPTQLDTLLAVCRRGFRGIHWGFTANIGSDDLLRAATVPSNLRNLNELTGSTSRRRLAELLFRAGVPGWSREISPGREALALTWTVGAFQRAQ